MIAVELIGDQQLIARLRVMPDGVRNGLARAVTKLALEGERLSKQKTSGEVLKVRTGVLRSSINIGNTPYVTATGVMGQWGTNVRYAGVHEFGFRGTVSVRAHLRQVTQVFGRPISATQHVRAHSRRMNLPERSFLRSALKEMQPRIETEMRAAVGEATHR
jgi:phage gpG-like protein